MPDGKTHKILHTVFYPLPVVVSGLMLANIDRTNALHLLASLSIPLGYWMGNYIDPDLDMLRVRTRAEQAWRKTRWLAWVNMWWFLYAVLARFMGGHRSFWTHAPFLSTAIRLGWLFGPLVLIALFLGGVGPVIADILWALMAGIWFGLSLSDSVHTLFDVLF